MNIARIFPLVLCWSVAPLASAGDFPQDPLGWPAVQKEHKPWTRWWWPGSAVDKENLTRQLEAFADKGLGGVEICPIYGAVGAESRYLDFLSPRWMEMLAHVTSEAKRLGLGVDMTTGTGWPFGGPQVTPQIASNDLHVVQKSLAGGDAVSIELPDGALQCLRAFPADGNPLDLAALVKDGKLDWQAPAGTWEIIGLISRSPIQKVKRSAPGGAGNVLDPFSADAMTAYLARFDAAFEDFDAPLPRAQFHDSFEYYEAQWTPDFLDEFRSARGYDLREQLPAFVGKGSADDVMRVRADYRKTLSELHLAYLEQWHDWAQSRGEITRNQAHGSPGNLLDHYAVSEIPETEIFRHVDERQIPMMKIAASAAHTKGGNLVSAEAFTWLDEHFQVTPEKLKDAADFIFLAGVNHILFHGIPYSPEDAGWPGWQFYASTHMGPNGGLWRDLSAFTGYLQRCQAILQSGESTADALIYFPIHDLWHNAKDKLPLFTIHNQDEWLWPTSFYQASMELEKSGIDYDYASDSMLAKAEVKNGKLILGGHRYSALVLSGVKQLPIATAERVRTLADLGATIIFQNGFPTDVPGFHDVAPRRVKLTELVKAMAGNVRNSGSLLLPELEKLGVRRELMTDSGLRFIRRSHNDGYHYFIANRGKQAFDGVVPLGVDFKSAAVLDPWQPANSHVVKPGKQGIHLRLGPGQSTLLRTFTERSLETSPRTEISQRPQTFALAGPWKIQFIDGGPELPAAAEMKTLQSWTALPGAAVKNFSGTARYTTTFDFPTPLPDACRLNLGSVANTARIILNGEDLGISWCQPHTIDLGGALKSGENNLQIEVTNLAANRIADLDRRGVEWKKFHEINFVNIDYKPFDASAWPARESGLLGPVHLEY